MFPRTAIYATVGPACRAPSVLEGMIRAGAMALRIHGGLAGEEGVRWWTWAIRRASEAVGQDVRILLDLPGPGLRIGVPMGAFGIRPEETLRLAPEGALGEGERGFTLPATEEMAWAEVGRTVLLGDGQERLEVERVAEDGVWLRVVEGDTIRPGMSFYAVGAPPPQVLPTPRDRALLKVGLEAGVDGIAQSFVTTAADVVAVRRMLVRPAGRSTLLVAKIERVAALEDLRAIADAADVLLIARGDLGVDAGFERVPLLQRRIAGIAAVQERPTILATDILGSMRRAPRPTRAEVADVAAAVREGIDALLLTGETALGTDPVRVVWTLAEVLRALESGDFPPLSR